MRRMVLVALLLVVMLNPLLTNLIQGVGISDVEAAESGWLLLIPPFDQDKVIQRGQGTEEGPRYPLSAALDAATGTFLNKAAPLKDWEQLGAFDSALQCEETRTYAQDKAMKDFKGMGSDRPSEPKKRGPGLSQREMLESVMYSRMMEARCLPASVVYPSKP